jgi:hypothetical protein
MYRQWAPTRWPRWKISIMRALIRTSTSARISACGTEYRKSWTSM